METEVDRYVTDEEAEDENFSILGPENTMILPEWAGHAWYSEEMARKYGFHILKAPGGKTVRITCKSKRFIKDGGTKWPDIQYQGIVIFNEYAFGTKPFYLDAKGNPIQPIPEE